jgi:hypothetical protein
MENDSLEPITKRTHRRPNHPGVQRRVRGNLRWREQHAKPRGVLMKD